MPTTITLYIGSFDGSFFAIDTNTGAQKWVFDAGNIIASSAAIDAVGLIFVTTLDGTIYVLRDDGSQATVLWTYSLGASYMGIAVYLTREYIVCSCLGLQLQAWHTASNR